jgi:hypothetical protein
MAFTEKTVSWVGLIEFGIPNEIIRKYSETAWKFGLCHFLGRKKCGNLNFVIFCWKKCGKLDFIIFIGKKVRKVGLCHFYWRKKLRKLNFIIFNGGKRCGKLDFVIFDDGKVWKIETLQYFMVRINSENRTLSFFMLDKAWKVGL